MARRLLPCFLTFLLLSAGGFAASEIEPKVLGPTAGNVSDISSAYVTGKYFTVWRQMFMPSVGIWGAISDSDGKPLGPAFPVIANANALDLHLFADGDSFLLIWNEANQSTQFSRIDGSGHASAPALLDSSWMLRPDAFVDGRLISIAGDGATIFDRDGTKLRGGIAPANAWAAETAFAGKDSFFLAGRWPTLA